MRRVTVDERRARLAERHALTPAAGTGTALEATQRLVALHATDPGTVHLSLAARLSRPHVAAAEQALYGDHSLVRMLGMRRTVFVVPAEIVGVVQAACTADIAARERRKLVGYLEGSGIDGAPAWLREVEQATLAALRERGDALAADLSEDVPELQRQIVVGSGRWSGTTRLSTRVLFLLAADGLIVRGRPRGTWLSSQYRWATARDWLGTDAAEPPRAQAQAELARRWLTAFGPGTVADLAWWTGWTMTQTRRALARLETVDVTLDGGDPGLVLADDVDVVPPASPWAALLPALDPTPMGWKERDWYVGDHRPMLFDRSGNIGPTVWWSGRVVGGWAQRPDGTIAHRLLEDIGADGAAAVDTQVARLQAWFDDARVTPRFRTPLERELSA